jgi:hypothetical protein
MGGATLAAAIAGTTGGAGAGVFDLSEGAGTISIPSGFTSLTIEVWGGGGGGGFGTVTYSGFPEFEPQDAPGGGGGSGAYSKTIVAIGGGDTGKTIAYSVGAKGAGGVLGNPVGYAGGTSSASSGTFTIDEMICTGGNGGYGGLGVNGGRQGTGGTATGGNTTNTNGNGGAVYDQSGATAIAGVNSLTGGAGGNGGDPVEGGSAGSDGSNGRVRFTFS